MTCKCVQFDSTYSELRPLGKSKTLPPPGRYLFLNRYKPSPPWHSNTYRPHFEYIFFLFLWYYRQDLCAFEYWHSIRQRWSFVLPFYFFVTIPFFFHWALNKHWYTRKVHKRSLIFIDPPRWYKMGFDWDVLLVGNMSSLYTWLSGSTTKTTTHTYVCLSLEL